MQLPGLQLARTKGCVVAVVTSLVLALAMQLPGVEPQIKSIPPSLKLNWDENTSVPLLLSQTGVFSNVKTLEVVSGLIPYEINVPFYSDGTEKFRWISLSVKDGVAPIGFHPTETWKFSKGTVLVKHFELGQRRIETRILQLGEDEIFGATYRWRADHSDADLVTEGVRAEVASPDGKSLQHPYYFPGPQDCKLCHTPQAGSVLGVNTRQLNRIAANVAPGENQLVAWSRMGFFDHLVTDKDVDQLPRLAAVSDKAASVEHRARSFLDVNCAMCHQPGGATGNFDARFSTSLAAQNLVNGSVILDMGIEKARVISPNDPWRSILLVRLNSLDDGIKMPPVGHETVDAAGADIIKQWVLSMEGQRVTAPPQMEPAGGEFSSVASIVLHHGDPEARIYYTRNGLPPDETSALFEGSIVTTRPVTIRACAIKPGEKPSISIKGTFVLKR